MQLPRRHSLPVLLVLTALIVLTSACAGIASPEGWASPTIDDGLLLAAHDDKLYALDSQELTQLWRFPPEGGEEKIEVRALYGTPAIAGDSVLVPTFEGDLFSLDRETGATNWVFEEADGPIIGAVALSEDAATAYFGADDGHVYAVEVDSGNALWPVSFKTDDGVWSTPTVVGDTVYITSLDGSLYAVDAESGSEEWSFDAGAAIAGSALVDEATGFAYIGGFDSELRAVDLDTHEEVWARKAGNWFWTLPLLADGVVYAGALDGKVYAFDAATGDPRWPEPFDVGSPVRATPLLHGGNLIVVDREGNVFKLNPEDGAAIGDPLILDADVLADPIVIAGAADGEPTDTLVIVTTGGDLVRIDPETFRAIEARPLSGEN